jgi:hypothetical protein
VGGATSSSAVPLGMGPGAQGRVDAELKPLSYLAELGVVFVLELAGHSMLTRSLRRRHPAQLRCALQPSRGTRS